MCYTPLSVMKLSPTFLCFDPITHMFLQFFICFTHKYCLTKKKVFPKIFCNNCFSYIWTPVKNVSGSATATCNSRPMHHHLWSSYSLLACQPNLVRLLVHYSKKLQIHVYYPYKSPQNFFQCYVLNHTVMRIMSQQIIHLLTTSDEYTLSFEFCYDELHKILVHFGNISCQINQKFSYTTIFLETRVL